MAEIQVPDSQQPEIDHGMMEVDALAPMDFSDKIEIVSLPLLLRLEDMS